MHLACLGSLAQINQYTFQKLAKRAVIRKEYVKLYTDLVLNSKFGNKKQHARLSAIEEGDDSTLTVDDILIFRAMAINRHGHPTSQSPQSQSPNSPPEQNQAIFHSLMTALMSTTPTSQDDEDNKRLIQYLETIKVSEPC